MVVKGEEREVIPPVMSFPSSRPAPLLVAQAHRPSGLRSSLSAIQKEALLWIACL